MSNSLRNENAPGRTLGRHFLRAVLALIFVAVAIVLGRQGFAVRNLAQILLYLALFAATDWIANGVLNRLAKQENPQTQRGDSDSNSD